MFFKMKTKIFIFLFALVAFGFMSCNNNEDLNINNEVPSIELDERCEIRTAIRTTIADLRTQENFSARDIEIAVYRAFGIEKAERSISTRNAVRISDEALSVVSKFDAVEALDFSTHTEYLSALDNVLEANKSILTNDEYDVLLISLDVTAAIVDVVRDDEFEPLNPDELRAWWGRWGGCITKTAGLAGGGALAGGAALGPWGAVGGGLTGALVGYAENCHEMLFPDEGMVIINPENGNLWGGGFITP
jgi:hypothetical protein